jgi:hypothetical protein
MMNDPPSCDRRSRSPFAALPPLSDEAAAAISDFLVELHVLFDNRYFAQLRRFHQQQRPDPADPHQPWLTGLPLPDSEF